MRRLPVALALITGAFVLAGWLLYPVAKQVPASLTAAEHGGTVDLQVDDVTVLTSADCVTARWRVDRIKAVELDREGVTGEGTNRSCDSTIDLDVTFQDGATETYTIPKQILTASMINRILVVAALAALGLGVLMTGLPSALAARVGASAAGRALTARLPVLDERGPVPHGVLAALVGILLIGAAVRTHFLSQSLRFDESWTYLEFASQPISFILQDYRAPNNHIAHTLLVHATTSTFGVYPWTLRLPVYFAGLLVIAATFAVARRFYGLKAGLLAAALAAGASWMIEFSTNARGYNLVTLCFLVMLLLASDLRRRSRRRQWLVFAVLGALGMFTVPTMAYPLGLVCLWLGLSIVLENRGYRRWLLLRDMALAVLLMIGLTALLYYPAYAYIHSGVRRNFQFDNLAQVTWADFTETLSLELGKVWDALRRDLAPWVGGLLMVGVAVSVIFHRRMTRIQPYLPAIALLWLPAAVFIQLGLTYDRLWTFLQPLYLIEASAGLLYFGRLIAPRRFQMRIAPLAGAAVLVALVSAVGDVRSNSVELAESGRGLGIEAAVLTLRDVNTDLIPIYCAHKCPQFQFYGLMYHVKIEENYRDPTPLRSVIVAEAMFDGEIDVKRALREVGVPRDQYQAPQEVFSEGDTKVFRLDPLGAGE